jgi:Pyruvate/2-oxoglutarate dehydrogenase complex, dehydrogenase (E1) component, eukaryotic type, alpha subunit
MELQKDFMQDIYLRMRKICEFETRAQGFFAEGRMHGAAHLYNGEEAVAAGICKSLTDNDYITSTHRGHGHIIAKGGELKYMMAELFGRETGYCRGKGGSMHIDFPDMCLYI